MPSIVTLLTHEIPSAYLLERLSVLSVIDTCFLIIVSTRDGGWKVTLSVAWVRKIGSIEELVVASDSRLSGGESWDGNPKILLLPRTDAVIAFAGLTHSAYPLMLQAINAINNHQPAVNRVMDLTDLKGHLVRVFNHSRSFISDLPFGQYQPDLPGSQFLLAGYSSKEKRFRIWNLHFQKGTNEFTFAPIRMWRGQDGGSLKLVRFIGDFDAVTEAKRRLVEMLVARNKIETGSLNMEPFEILVELIRENRFSSVGGPPQMVKVYDHSNAAPVGVYWPDKASGQVCMFGRPLMKYEKTSWGVMDPDKPTRAYPSNGGN